MKQKFILSFAAVVFSVLVASAQNEEKLIVNAGAVEHIRIANDMDIVLMQAMEGDKSVSMNANTYGKLDLQLANNAMTISSVNQSAKQKPTVFLYVNNLKTLIVETNSTVKTIGVLDAPKLDVYVDGPTTVHLKTNGDVQAHALSDREIKVKYLSENWLAKNRASKAVARK